MGKLSCGRALHEREKRGYEGIAPIGDKKAIPLF